MTENPLLSVSFIIPFDRISPTDVEPGIRELIRRAQAGIDAIAEDDSPRTFDNTMLAIERATENLDYAMAVVRHLESVNTSPELRAAWNAVEPEASEFYSRIPLNEGLWNRLKAYAETEEAKSLRGTKLRFLTKTLDSFRRHGAELDPEGKKRLAEMDVEMTKLTTKFSENVLDSTNAWDLVITDEAQLAGLPSSALEAARQSAQARGVEGWRFTLQAPSYIAAMTYLDDRDIREKMWHAFSTRATKGEHDNRPLILRILELRSEKAKLLGFADFADFVLHDRMAHRGERAMAFVEDLRAKTDKFF
jgi:oligopeptidase A